MPWINLTPDEIAGLAAISAYVPALSSVHERLQAKIEAAANPALVDHDDAYRSAAEGKLWSKFSDGDAEIDEDAIVSEGDDPGAYVMVWMWITHEEAGFEVTEDA